MASPKAKTAIVIGVVLVLGAITFLTVKIRAHVIQTRALAELKENNPVEYYVLHTPMTQKGDELKNEMEGKWRLTGAHSRRTGGFVFLQPGNYYFKIFTETNWAIATYDTDSNLLYSASGRYTLQGENYSEYIDAATGTMVQYLHANPHFKIRVVGDKYYQMGLGKNPSVEEMWQRVDD
ncbi:MAG: hypothetical protein WBN75_09635 [Verrucomicrobiia bacterium]|jgi:hypothetical protein